MKKTFVKTAVVFVLLLAFAVALTACSKSDETQQQDQQQNISGQLATYSNIDVTMPAYSAPDISELPQATYSNGDFSYELDQQSESSGTVYFDDPIGWGDTYIYYWSDSNKNMTSWPGPKMEQFEGVWRYTLPDGVEYIIFSNGAMQTRDVPYNPAQTNYRLSAQRDQDNSYYVEDWQGNIVSSDRVDPYGVGKN